jgi:hypothetical protein
MRLSTALPASCVVLPVSTVLGSSRPVWLACPLPSVAMQCAALLSASCHQPVCVDGSFMELCPRSAGRSSTTIHSAPRTLNATKKRNHRGGSSSALTSCSAAGAFGAGAGTGIGIGSTNASTGAGSGSGSVIVRDDAGSLCGSCSADAISGEDSCSCCVRPVRSPSKAVWQLTVVPVLPAVLPASSLRAGLRTALRRA